MEEATRPLLKHDKVDEDGHVSDASSSHGRYRYSSINATGPQLCHSPPPYSYVIASSVSPTSIQGGGHPLETRVYLRRWYILIVYSLLAGTQGGVWNTFGPIAATSKDAFGWGDPTIALLSNWGPISYLIGGIFFSWLLDVKGLRISCLLTAALVAVGTSLRCITMETPAVTWLMHVGQFFNGLGGPVAMAAPPFLSAVWLIHIGQLLNGLGGPVAMAAPTTLSATWLMHVGQMLNGLAGPVAMGGPPAVSATWFPPHERTTATAIGSLFALLGTGSGFILGPLLVPDVPQNATANASSLHFSPEDQLQYHGDNLFTGLDQVPLEETKEDRVSKERKAIHLFMYIEAGWSLALFLVILIYFPKKPPLPPCPSASLQREGFLNGLKHLLTRWQFWLVGSVYGISLGVLNCWSSVLDVVLSPHGIGEKEAGWIGFYAVCSACVVSLIVARFADTFSRVMKWLVLSFYVVGTAAFAVFALTTINIIPSSTAILYATIIIGMTALNAAVPLIFELSCELSYPTGEGTTNGVLTIINNFAGLIFLFVMMIPHIGSSWTNWTIVGASGICLPLLLLMKEQYNRLEIDEHNPSLTAEIIIPPPEEETVEAYPQA
ncbi:hypothetical protein BaRGS_00013076 [Batillaria attramentaria]|uniref:Uncharacterized protein n=1 Tax=Batillaria attramentaria TaxID=370345 RepID=A0ABD0L7Q0_9CAEN